MITAAAANATDPPLYPITSFSWRGKKKKKAAFCPSIGGKKNIKPLVLLHGDRTLWGKAAPKRCPPSMKRSVRIKNNIIIGEKGEGGGGE